MKIFVLNKKTKKCKDCNYTALHLLTTLYSFTCSDFAFGFHTLTPMNPPIPDTAAITAKTIRYDNTILKNSIKFDMILPRIPPPPAWNPVRNCRRIKIYTIIIPLVLVYRQAGNFIKFQSSRGKSFPCSVSVCIKSLHVSKVRESYRRY